MNTGILSVMISNHPYGIAERNKVGSNTWTTLAVYGNFGLGIDKLAKFGNSANVLDLPLSPSRQSAYRPVSSTGTAGLPALVRISR